MSSNLRLPISAFSGIAMFFSLVMTPSSKASQPSLLKSFPPVLLRTNDQPFSFNLTNYFKADPATNMVRVTTSLANSNGIPLGFTLQLLPANAPKTVANFLAYVKEGAYENTLVHRSVKGFVIQSGGYDFSETLYPHGQTSFQANMGSRTSGVPLPWLCRAQIRTALLINGLSI